MKRLITAVIISIVVILSLIQQPASAANNDFVHVLQHEYALEQAHATYFAVVYVVTGHVPATQGRIAEIGSDYFCIQHAPSHECFLLDKVSSVDFFDGQ